MNGQSFRGNNRFITFLNDRICIGKDSTRRDRTCRLLSTYVTIIHNLLITPASSLLTPLRFVGMNCRNNPTEITVEQVSYGPAGTNLKVKIKYLNSKSNAWAIFL